MRLRLILTCIALSLLIRTPTTLQDAPLKVVVSFSILADVVQNVANMDAHHIEVTTLIPDGVDPHSYEPSAQDIASLQDADVIFVAGVGFEETLWSILADIRGTVIVEASACVPMRALGIETAGIDLHEEIVHEMTREDILGRGLRRVCAEYDAFLTDFETRRAEEGRASIRAEDVETRGPMFMAYCGHYDPLYDHVGGDHDHGLCDPHVWTDPRNVYYWTLYIRDILSGVDRENAPAYTANADAYINAIDDLVRQRLESLLAAIPPERRVLMTNHDTLGYFAAAYGFEQVGFILPGGSTLAEPSARDLAALIDLIRAEDIPAIFVESTVSPRVAEQLAAETGVEIYTLYTDSLSGPDGPAFTYLDYLTYNFTTIAAALTPQ